MQHYKRAPLTKADIKTLKYQYRPGIIFPLMLLIIAWVFVWFISSGNAELMIWEGFDFTWFLFVAIFSLAFLMHFSMTRKFRKDIKKNVKNVVLKTVQRLEQKTDFEAGSGMLYIGQDMNSFQIYYVIVDNVRYRVDEKLFNVLEEGGEVAFHYGPASNYLISLAAPG